MVGASLGGRLDQHAAENRRFLGDALGHGRGLSFLHQALGLDQRRQRFSGQLARLALRQRSGFARRHDATDEAHFQRRLGQKRFAQQQRFSGAAIAHQLRREVA